MSYTHVILYMLLVAATIVHCCGINRVMGRNTQNCNSTMTLFRKRLHGILPYLIIMYILK